MRWSGDRLIAKLNREYAEMARRLGPDQADEFLRLQALATIKGDDAKRFDLFGREEMLQGMAAAGVKIPRS